jgi:hypothetical protein
MVGAHILNLNFLGQVLYNSFTVVINTVTL